MALAKTTQVRINKDAESYAGKENSCYTNDLNGYIAGATAENKKAKKLVDALEMANREIISLYKEKGYIESFVTRTIDESLQQWKEGRQ